MKKLALFLAALAAIGCDSAPKAHHNSAVDDDGGTSSGGTGGTGRGGTGGSVTTGGNGGGGGTGGQARPADAAAGPSDAPVADAGARAADATAAPGDAGTVPGMPGAVQVLTNRYSTLRLGWNDKETALNPQTVNAMKFGKLFVRKVMGQIYAQPLVVSGLMVPGKGTQNVVFVATQANKVYAFNADAAAMDMPLWTADFGMGIPYVAMTSPDFNTKSYCWCGDIMPQLGITSTPVIDLAKGTLYVLSKHLENTTFVQRLHALDITTGMERAGSPVVIQATVPGTGAGSTGGMLNFDPRRQHSRPGMLLLNGTVYMGFASHGDTSPYHGWLLGYDAATLKQTQVFVTTPNGNGGGIWMGGGGIVADGQGNIYFSTGNGDDDVDPTKGKLSEAVLKLSTAGGKLTLADWYIAGDYAKLNGADADLGSSAVLLLPKLNLLVAAGKGGPSYLIKADALGHYVADDSQVQKLANGRSQFGGHVYWEGPAGPVIFTWPDGSKVSGFKIANGKAETTPSYASVALASSYGGALSISSSGAAGGILWAYSGGAPSMNWSPQPGVLHAYDATDLTKELWVSSANKMRDDPGSWSKFGAPVVANGKVYVASWSDQLDVYGLLP